MEHILFISGHPDDKQSANVFITNFKVFPKAYLERIHGLLPDEIAALIDRN